jgi:hypothetical protein
VTVSEWGATPQTKTPKLGMTPAKIRRILGEPDRIYAPPPAADVASWKASKGRGPHPRRSFDRICDRFDNPDGWDRLDAVWEYRLVPKKLTEDARVILVGFTEGRATHLLDESVSRNVNLDGKIYAKRSANMNQINTDPVPRAFRADGTEDPEFLERVLAWGREEAAARAPRVATKPPSSPVVMTDRMAARMKLLTDRTALQGEDAYWAAQQSLVLDDEEFARVLAKIEKTPAQPPTLTDKPAPMGNGPKPVKSVSLGGGTKPDAPGTRRDQLATAADDLNRDVSRFFANRRKPIDMTDRSPESLARQFGVPAAADPTDPLARDVSRYYAAREKTGCRTPKETDQ